jgi:hypothetical protein
MNTHGLIGKAISGIDHVMKQTLYVIAIVLGTSIQMTPIN